MNFAALKFIRYVVPGILLYVLLYSICWVTIWCSLPLPNRWEELGKLTAAAVLAFVYNAVDLRERMNSFYFDAVNSNLITRLTSPFAGDPSVPKPLTWRNVRPIFYRIIDSDPSLKHQAQRAFFNGALWTSAADLRAISLIGVLLFSATLLIGNLIGRAEFDFGLGVFAILMCLVLAGVSFGLSKLITKRHIEIGNEQVDFILAHHRQVLHDHLARINV